MPKSTRPLTQPMLTALTGAVRGEDGHLVLGSEVRTGTVVALIDRDMVTAGKVHTLTGAGLQARHKALPAGADLDEATEDRAPLDVVADPLEAPLPQTPAQRAAAEGDRNAKVRAENERRDAVRESSSETRCGCNPHPVFGHEDGCRYVGMGAASRVGTEDKVELDLPQRVPGKALTQELTGEVHPLVSAGRPGHRAQVLLRPLGAEILERASRETFVAVGADWRHLEGQRVRIGCMDGDVFHQRPLHIMEAGKSELAWKRPQDQTVHAPLALYVGATVLVDGCRVYQVGISPVAGELPRLWPVK